MNSNPGAGYWMDIFTLICCKICIVYLRIQKINEKEAEDGPFKKYFSSFQIPQNTKLWTLLAGLLAEQLLREMYS